MSKKLIAVAAAAALALTGLVAAPANSTVGPFAITVNGESAGTGLNADAAYTVKLPTQDVLRYNSTHGATTSTFRIEVQTPGTTDTVRVVTTGGVKALTKTAFDGLTSTTNNTKVGTADVSQAAVGGSAEFILYTTSTTAASVTVSSGSNSQTFWVKGINPAAYNVVAKSNPTTVATSADTKIDFTVTDAFGNAIEATQTVVITKVGPINLSTASALTWDTDRKTLYLTVSGSAAGNASVNVEIGAANGATKVDAFGTPKTSFFTVAVGGTQAELITALTAQVTALTADYKLAARWNKRVADKKAPKKAVATK
jgi:hypothetical protein